MIALLGYMGSGKSTIAKSMAAKLGLISMDLDEYIEDTSGQTITQIFAQYGAYYFRSLERSCLKEVLFANQCDVLALGGGTPCFYDNMDFIKEYAHSIYLKCDTDLLIERIYSNTENRPLLQDKSKSELANYVHASLKERLKFYEKAELIIQNKNIETTIEQIKKTYYEDIHQDR